MALEATQKQTYEAYTIDFEFDTVLAAGEELSPTIGDHTVVALDNTQADASATVLDDTSKSVVDSENGVVNSTLRIQIRAGEEGKSPYKVTAKVKTTATPANQWEMDMNIKVKEI